MVLRVGTGVGAGLILEGTLLHGHRAAAGEIGHVVVDPRGEPCACGRTGCLETLLAVPHLRRRRSRAPPAARAGRRRRSGSAPRWRRWSARSTCTSWCSAARPSCSTARCATPSSERSVRRTMPVIGDELVVRTSTLGDDVVLVGAAVLVLAGELGVS